MYDVIIREYLKRLTINDIDNFALKNNVILKQGESKILYDAIINNWKTLYKEDPTNILNDLKNKLSNNTYNKALELYKFYKNKLN